MDIQTHSEEPSLTISKLFTYGISALLNVAIVSDSSLWSESEFAILIGVRSMLNYADCLSNTF